MGYGSYGDRPRRDFGGGGHSSGRFGGGGGRGGFGGGFSPVKEGEELDVKIEAVGEKGDGIAKKQGFVLFIPGAKVGEEVKIRVTKVLRKVGFAEVIGKATGPVAADEKPAKSSEGEESGEEKTESSEEEKEEEYSDDGQEDSEEF